MGSVAAAAILVCDKNGAISSRDQIERSDVGVFFGLAQGLFRSQGPIEWKRIQNPSGNSHQTSCIACQGNPLHVPASNQWRIETYGQDRVPVRPAVVAPV